MNLNFAGCRSIKQGIVLAAAILCSLGSCKNSNADILSAINDVTHNSVTDSTKGIFLIRDNKCLNCSQSLINFAQRTLREPGYLNIIAADPNKVDLSTILNARNSFVTEPASLQQKGLENSAFIRLKNGRIQNITQLNADNIDSFARSFVFNP